MSIEQASITNCNYFQKEVGKMVPGSKLKFEWDFCYNGQTYKVELKDSRLSRKKELMVNGKTILPRKV
jgi:hypothetical protein